MDDDMEKAFASLVEAIRGLQAGQIAQARMVQAIIASHPDPDALREAWRSYSAGPAADAATSKILDPQRAAVHEALAEAIQDWTGYLERSLRGPSSRPS